MPLKMLLTQILPNFLFLPFLWTTSIISELLSKSGYNCNLVPNCDCFVLEAVSWSFFFKRNLVHMDNPSRTLNLPYPKQHRILLGLRTLFSTPPSLILSSAFNIFILHQRKDAGTLGTRSRKRLWDELARKATKTSIYGPGFFCRTPVHGHDTKEGRGTVGGTILGELTRNETIQGSLEET